MVRAQYPDEGSKSQIGVPHAMAAGTGEGELYFRDLPARERENMLDGLYDSIRFLVVKRQPHDFGKFFSPIHYLRNSLSLFYVRAFLTIVIPLFLSSLLLAIDHTSRSVALLEGSIRAPRDSVRDPYLSDHLHKQDPLGLLLIQDKIERARYLFEKRLVFVSFSSLFLLFAWGQWLFLSARLALSDAWSDIEVQNDPAIYLQAEGP